MEVSLSTWTNQWNDFAFFLVETWPEGDRMNRRNIQSTVDRLSEDLNKVVLGGLFID